MGLVTGLTKRVEIPHEPGQWMIFRQLSWRQREKASEAQTDTVLNRVKGMGPELLRELQGAAERPDVKAALADEATRYDKALILHYGIVSWSYKEEVSDENIDALDEATADWATREILDHSGPPSEEERKND